MLREAFLRETKSRKYIKHCVRWQTEAVNCNSISEQGIKHFTCNTKVTGAKKVEL